MMVVNYKENETDNRRERILEKRIEILRRRIHQLESEILSKSSLIQADNANNSNKTKPPFLVLPVTYTAEHERSPKLEIVSCSAMNDSHTPLLLVEKLNAKVYETIV